LTEIRVLLTKVIAGIKGTLKFAKGKLASLGNRLAKLLEDVNEFLEFLLEHCHESKITCNFRPLEKTLKSAGKTASLPEKGVELVDRISEARGVLAGHPRLLQTDETVHLVGELLTKAWRLIQSGRSSES
jgi:hypothetical protein